MRRPTTLTARQQHINTFVKGMNKDLSKTVHGKNSYLDAQNIRVTTDKGLTNGAVVNVKGNSLNTTIPDISGVFKIKEKEGAVWASATYSVSINTANGPFTHTFTASTVTEYFKELENAGSDPSSLFYPFTIVRSSYDSVVIYHPTLKINSLSVPASDPVEVETYCSFTDKSMIQVIGSTTIRDDIYLFTTSSDSTSGGDGHIWKLVHDDKDNSLTSISLMYAHSDLKFSAEYPIQALGRYENATTSRLYWVDNFNHVRSLNVGDPGCIGTEVKLLDIVSEVSFSKPTFTEIKEGGNLKSGVYQFAYRLRSYSGALTRFSPVSEPVHVTKSSESGTSYSKYQSEYNGSAGGEDTSKQLIITIPSIDLRYDVVEIVSIYRQTKNGSPVFNIFVEEPLNNQPSKKVSLTGNESVTSITYSEFNAFGEVFDRAKTIVSKDNKIFLGNVKISNYNNIEFNARAFRFNNATDTYLGTTFNWLSDNHYDDNVPQVAVDAVNPWNDNQFTSTAADIYKYKSDGATLGGEGPNVSYTFVKQEIEGDSRTSITPPTPAGALPASNQLPVVDKAKDPTTGTWNDFKSPYVTSTLRGYSRGELYRFGLVLYDKLGRPGFVKWIGDIRFPEAWENDSLGTGDISSFPFGSVYKNSLAGNAKSRGLSLGIKFRIDISTIKDQISGYSIVRVKREEKDRTRLGSGILNSLYEYTVKDATGKLIENMVGLHSRLAEGSDTANYSYHPIALRRKAQFMTMDSPDFHFNGPPSYQSGDTLIITSTMQDPEGKMDNPNIWIDEGGNGVNDGFYIKWNRHNVTTLQTAGNNRKAIEDCIPAEAGEVVTFTGDADSINTFANVGASASGANEPDSIGGKTLFLRMSADVGVDIVAGSGTNWPAEYGMLSGGAGRNYKLHGTYYRPIADQYGGNTEAARERNVYISCNHFQSVNSATASIIDTEVFGGDVYVVWYDQTKMEKNYGPTNYGNGTMSNWSEESTADVRYSYGQMFWTESNINTDLRTGYHYANKIIGGTYPNKTLDTTTGTTIAQAGDQYLLEDVYHVENDITLYVPKNVAKKFEDEFDNRVYYSETKVNGEEIDSWRTFYTASYKDVEGLYGPITNLCSFRDEVYFHQDEGFGKLAINPRAVVQGTDGIDLNLAVGAVIQDFGYISTEAGSSHQWSILPTENGIYFFDMNRRKMFRFTGRNEPISDIKGLSGYFAEQFSGEIITNDNPILRKGITTTYDSRYNEALFTFHDRTPKSGLEPGYDFTSFTIAYNEFIGAYSSFYSFKPVIYVNDGKKILSPTIPTIRNLVTDPFNANTLYLHDSGEYGNFYGTVSESSLDIIVNPFPAEVKVFDNITFHTEVYDGTLAKQNETFTGIRFYNDYQNSDWVTLTPASTVKRAEREWQLPVARNKVLDPAVDLFSPANIDSAGAVVYKDRIRDKYMIVNFKYDNANNRRTILHYLKTLLRISPR